MSHVCICGLQVAASLRQQPRRPTVCGPIDSFVMIPATVGHVYLDFHVTCLHLWIAGGGKSETAAQEANSVRPHRFFCDDTSYCGARLLRLPCHMFAFVDC